MWPALPAALAAVTTYGACAEAAAGVPVTAPWAFRLSPVGRGGDTEKVASVPEYVGGWSGVIAVPAV